MRKSIDGLSAIVSQNFKLNPFENALFLFCRKKRDRMKALLQESDGFLLLYKRLEGGVFQWSRTTEEVREITPQQYRWLIDIGLGLFNEAEKEADSPILEPVLFEEPINQIRKGYKRKELFKNLPSHDQIFKLEES